MRSLSEFLNLITVIDLFLIIFFASPKKTIQKKGDFSEVFFALFYRTPKNRLKRAKFFPRLQKLFTLFSNYTSVKESIRRNIIILINILWIWTDLFYCSSCILIIFARIKEAVKKWNGSGCDGKKLLAIAQKNKISLEFLVLLFQDKRKELILRNLSGAIIPPPQINIPHI